MTVRKHNDATGYERGCGAYSATSIKLAHPRHIPPVQSVDGKGGNLSKPSAVSKGGPPRYKPKSGPITNGGGATMA
jgi:hypothetical protein